MFTRTKASFLAAAVIAPFLLPATVAAQNEGAEPTGPTESCSGTVVASWPDVQFDSLAATIVSAHPWIESTRSLTVNVPAGEYQVDVVTYDGSATRDGDTAQEFEQLFLEFLDAQGDVIATTGSSADLPDRVLEATWKGSVGTVTLDRDAETVRAVHAFIGLAGYQSVMPSCFGATFVPPTTTTTEAPPPSSSTTTTVVEPPPSSSTTTTVVEPPPSSSTTTTLVEPPSSTSLPPTTTIATTTTTTTVPTQVLPKVEEMPDPDPVVADPHFTG
jgi:hypothetical protein